MTGTGTTSASARVASILIPCSMPSLIDVGIDDGGDAGIGEAQGEIARGKCGCLAPAFDRDLAIAGIDADGNAIRIELGRFAHQCRIAGSDSSENDTADTLVEPHGDCREIANAAAKLHRDRDASKYHFDGCGVDRLSGEGTVEIDQMQPLESLALESEGLSGGIGIEDGRRLHVALLQAHALTVFEVDGGKQDHGCQRRKLAIKARPSAWLFSGWN